MGSAGNEPGPACRRLAIAVKNRSLDAGWQSRACQDLEVSALDCACACAQASHTDHQDHAATAARAGGTASAEANCCAAGSDSRAAQSGATQSRSEAAAGGSGEDRAATG